MEQEQEGGLGPEGRLKRRLRSGLRWRAGRVRFGPLLLVVPLFLGALLAHWFMPRKQGEWASFEPADLAGVPDLDADVPSAVDGFAGEADLADGSRLAVRLSPWEVVDHRQRFRSGTLRARLGLGEGELWRVELTRSAPADAEADALTIRLADLAVVDGEGPALGAVLDGAADPIPAPERTLYASPVTGPKPGESSVLVRWGRRPVAEARLTCDGGGVVVPLAARVLQTGDLARSLRPGAAAPVEAIAATEGDPRDATIAALRADLAAERGARRERELAWYQYNRALADLDIAALVGTFPVNEEFVPDEVAIDGAPTAEPTADEVDAHLARATAIYHRLRNLLRVQEVFGLDLLEVGELSPRGIGPAIFRTLDDRGRLTGSLHADLLRLEGSRAARTLTLVLEGGYESRRGERIPFEGGERRIVFPFVDPEVWMESLPELFSPLDLVPDLDDGLWRLEPLRVRLNSLLERDRSTGLYRVWGVGGVLGDRLVDVQLEHYDTNGAPLARYFADRMRILLEPPGVLLLLEGGAIVRGEEKTPFLDGEHRIFLPGAPLDAWRGAAIPGWGQPPARDGG